MIKEKLEVYLFTDEDFKLIPYIWKMGGRFSGERAKYFGHTYAMSLYWLWFELQLVWVPVYD